MKHFYFTFLLLFVILSSCRKDNSVIIRESNSPQDASSYYPLTKSSTRTYIATTGSATMKSVETVSGLTSVFNNKTYYEITNTFDSDPTVYKNYLYEGENIYRMRSTTIVNQITIDMQYLNDKEPVGYTWTETITPTGKINDVPARMIGTIEEKNISKVVQGKTYNNVIHSTLELQYDFLSGYETAATYEFYVAKGIGVVLIESTIDTFGFVFTSKTELVSYNIK